MKGTVAFYKCETCGNQVVLIKNGGGQLVCCGKPMTELIANTTEASTEKHIPVPTKEDGKIKVHVGSAIHPMKEEHYIEWIALVSDDGIRIISLKPGDEPKAVFCYRENAEVYAYCNLHGLWKADV
ncbi:MAG TPA: desulfoferrodoxin [Syntrophomonadaceae bacterium]|nr:desulfoferrodoxin [Syntrophomonadaceae bacterium]